MSFFIPALRTLNANILRTLTTPISSIPTITSALPDTHFNIILKNTEDWRRIKLRHRRKDRKIRLLRRKAKEHLGLI